MTRLGLSQDWVRKARESDPLLWVTLMMRGSALIIL